jgi:hypothetical protein
MFVTNKKFISFVFFRNSCFKNLWKVSWVPLAPACKPSHLGDWDRKDGGSRPAQANSSQDLISKIITAKWTGDVVQAVEYLLCKYETLSSNPNPTKINTHETSIRSHKNWQKTKKKRLRSTKKGWGFGSSGRVQISSAVTKTCKIKITRYHFLLTKVRIYVSMYMPQCWWYYAEVEFYAASHFCCCLRESLAM